jgi:hypothetical protein
MDGFWAFFWLAVILKIPICALLYIVWWAIHQTDAEPEQADDGGGSDRHSGDPRRRPPRPPRRGPHADPPPRPPKRVRAKARKLSPDRD